MLKKLQSTLKSDNSVVLIGNLLASGFGLVTFMILARVLDKDGFGEWALFMSAASLADLMRTGLVRQGLVRAISVEADPHRHKQILNAAAAITTGFSIFLAAILALIQPFTSGLALHSFFVYYPILILASSIQNFDTWRAHAEGHFKRMNQLRMFTNMTFIAFVGLGAYLSFDLHLYFFAYIISNALISLYSLISTGVDINPFSAKSNDIKSLLGFGKHSVATVTGANLLKSADSLIIGWLLGKEAVAIYAIPLKVLDLVEIPLRGFVMTAYRQLSNLYVQNRKQEFIQILFSNLKKLTMAIFPAALLMVILPSFFIRILGGEGYEDSQFLLQLFMIPLILLPLDKFIGISLDAINLPKINALKVWVMAAINIVGDILAIVWIGELWAVALVTFVNILAGIIYGLIRHPLIMGHLMSIRSGVRQIAH